MLETLKKYNVMVFGSGAREKAIAASVKNSPKLKKLYIASASYGMDAEIIQYKDYSDLAEKCVALNIDLAVFGPEEPICKGVADIFKAHKIPCIATDKTFSQLESSKAYAKRFMAKHKIKTANYVLTENMSALNKINTFPLVIKADGLCGGKGVKIAFDKKEAENTLKEFLEGKFGENSKKVLLEEFINGEEISLMSLWDGKTLLNFPPARDFKKLDKNHSSPNTGGMGAFCPVNLNELQKDKLVDYQKQLKQALSEENASFCGFIYSGLIWNKNPKTPDWYVLEYNVRLGDPETQALLTHLNTDFLQILISATEQNLDKIRLEFKPDTGACLVIAASGYPENPIIGKEIILPEFPNDINVYFSGVKEKSGKLYSSGGRVLSLCKNSKQPFKELKIIAHKIEMQGKYYREDIDIN